MPDTGENVGPPYLGKHYDLPFRLKEIGTGKLEYIESILAQHVQDTGFDTQSPKCLVAYQRSLSS